MEVTPPRKKIAYRDSCYKTLAVLSILVGLLLLAVIALSANSIVLTVKVHELKAEIDLVKQGRTVEDIELENLTPGLSRQILDAIISEADQISDSAYPQTNSSIETLFQQLLQSTPDIDSMKEAGSSPELHSQQKRSISPHLALSLNSCFKVVTHLQHLVKKQSESINVLSDQLLLDIAEVDNRTLQLTDDIQQVNSSLSQQLCDKISDVEGGVEQVNASLSQQLMDLEEDILQVNVIGEFPTFPASSCADILESLPSGEYYVQNSNGDAVLVFCDMTLSCGNITGGWQRVIDLDFTNRSDPCPGGFAERNESGLRTCEPISTLAGCTPVTELSTSGVNYTRVCGKVINYQDSTPDAFHLNDLDVTYLDGVSLTHGSGPRTHIWSFAAGATESRTDVLGCPCVDGNPFPAPTVVGDNYFCESANPAVPLMLAFFVNDPLWDGQDCPETEDLCCGLNTPPWFFRELESTTDDPIEMRVCRDQPAVDEGTPLGSVEIYIRP